MGPTEATASGELDDRLPLPLLLVSTFGIGGVPQIVRRVAGKKLPFPMPSSSELAKTSVAILFDGAAPQKSRAQRKPVIFKRKVPG